VYACVRMCARVRVCVLACVRVRVCVFVCALRACVRACTRQYGCYWPDMATLVAHMDIDDISLIHKGESKYRRPLL